MFSKVLEISFYFYHQQPIYDDNIMNGSSPCFRQIRGLFLVLQTLREFCPAHSDFLLLFAGAIPDSLGRLNKLTKMNLSFNNLSGESQG